MAAAAAWLGHRTQLGTEVFERGAPEHARDAGRGRIGDITGLLQACLVILDVPEDAAAAFRVVVPFWSVADALGRMRALLIDRGDEEFGLERFLPAVPPDLPEREQRCRAAVASTFPVQPGVGANVLGPRNIPVDRENPDIVAPPRTDHGSIPNLKWSFADSHMRLEQGGWARETTINELPVSTEMAGVNMRLEAGAVRELHWHKATEWALMLKGTARVTIVDQNGRNFVDVGEVFEHGLRVGVEDVWPVAVHEYSGRIEMVVDVAADMVASVHNQHALAAYARQALGHHGSCEAGTDHQPVIHERVLQRWL